MAEALGLGVGLAPWLKVLLGLALALALAVLLLLLPGLWEGVRVGEEETGMKMVEVGVGLWDLPAGMGVGVPVGEGVRERLGPPGAPGATWLGVPVLLPVPLPVGLLLPLGVPLPLAQK